MGRPQKHGITVRHRPRDGRHKPWEAEWFETSLAGERDRKRQFFATEGEALAFKADMEAAAAALAPPPDPVLTAIVTPGAPSLSTAPKGSLLFRTFADQWLSDHVARCKPSTARSYRGLLETHVYPQMGALRVHPTTLGVEQIIRALSALAAGGMSWGTQKAIIRLLSSCLYWAVSYGHLPVNPCTRLIKRLKDNSRAEYDEPEPNPLSPTEVEAFLTWVATGRITTQPNRPVDGPKLRGGQLRSQGYPEWYVFFALLVWTGLRRGEATALQWDAVMLDTSTATARIKRNYSASAQLAASKQGQWSSGDTTVKTKEARTIDLPTALADLLRELARTRRADALQQQRPLSPYVFVTARGARMGIGKTANAIFEHGMAALGLTDQAHTLHDLRDTFATLHLLQNPGKLAWVSKMLGHKKVSTTLNRYTKWVPTADVNSYADDILPGQTRLGAAGER